MLKPGIKELGRVIRYTASKCGCKVNVLTTTSRRSKNCLEFQPLRKNAALTEKQMDDFAKHLQQNLKSDFRNCELRVNVDSKPAPLIDADQFIKDNNFIYKISVQVL